MMFEIDAIGEMCPKPLIKAKQALEKHTEISITVDNEISVENLFKMANELNYTVSKEKISDEIYKVKIMRNSDGLININSQVLDNLLDHYIVVINTNHMGQGDKILSHKLLTGFIYSLNEMEDLPESIIFYNDGAFRVIADSDSASDLLELEAKGVKIFVCGACVDFHKLQDKLAVGEITNMYNIVKMMTQAKRVVLP